MKMNQASTEDDFSFISLIAMAFRTAGETLKHPLSDWLGAARHLRAS